MAQENRLWGAERIRGALLKLDIKVSKRTVQKYMLQMPPRSEPTSQQNQESTIRVAEVGPFDLAAQND